MTVDFYGRRNPATFQSTRAPACDGVASAAGSAWSRSGRPDRSCSAHQAFLASDIEDVFVATQTQNAGSLAVAKCLGMTHVDDLDLAHHGVKLEVLRMRRADHVEVPWTTLTQTG